MPDQQEVSTLLNAYGVNASMVGASGEGISAAVIMAWIVFGTIGFCAMGYGWKQKAYQPVVLGVGLSAYPYFIHNTILLYVIGVGLTVGLFVWRD